MPATVLVIDDDPDFRESIRYILESHGYRTLEAPSGREGLKAAAEHKPDAIILDILMETSVEGYTVTHALKHLDEYAACRNIPVFMVSSIEETPDERFPMCSEVELIRPDRYFTKPLDVPRLLDHLERTIAANAAA